MGTPTLALRLVSPSRAVGQDTIGLRKQSRIVLDLPVTPPLETAIRIPFTTSVRDRPQERHQCIENWESNDLAVQRPSPSEHRLSVSNVIG
jgi:hypothetical protein